MNNIKNIVVAGEGKMGTSIFLYLNGFNFNLTWLCSGVHAAENARNTFKKKTGHMLNGGIINEAEHSLKLEETRIIYNLEEIAGCDLVIEAIPEKLSEKKSLFRQLDKILDRECIFTSNSSSLTPSDLTPSENRKETFTGLHFFYPVPQKKTVELIAGLTTSSETLEKLERFLLEINKKPFSQNESDPFILNRILLDMQAEAFNIISENIISVTGLDDIVKQHLFPLGIFEFFDHVGIDIMLSSVESYMRFASGSESYQFMVNSFREMTDSGKLGIKTGRGFYNYKGIKRITEPLNSETDISEIVQHSVLERLTHCLGKSCNRVLNSGVCSAEDLKFYLQDYLEADYDPIPEN